MQQKETHSVWRHTCIHMHIYIHKEHTHIHEYMCTYIYTCMYTNLHSHAIMHTCWCTHSCAHTHMHTGMCNTRIHFTHTHNTFICILTWTDPHRHTHSDTCTQECTDTHRQTHSQKYTVCIFSHPFIAFSSFLNDWIKILHLPLQAITLFSLLTDDELALGLLLSQGWGDESVGKTVYRAVLRTWTLIPRIHVRNHIWPHTPL